jgi:DNA excision repair protein ERCC-3
MAPPKRGRKSGAGYADDDEEYIVQNDSDYEEQHTSGRRKSAAPQKRGRKKTVAAPTSSVIHTTSISQGSIQEQQYQDFSKTLVLKPDHASRPVWITQDNLIYLEAFSPLYHQAYDFLVAIAEPESRPEFIHTYKLTENSLYAAVAVSIDTESIIKVLNRLCKTNVPAEVEEYIRQCTYTFGKAKIVLKENNFHIESKQPEILRELLKNPVISNARASNESDAAASVLASSTTTTTVYASGASGVSGASHSTHTASSSSSGYCVSSTAG